MAPKSTHSRCSRSRQTRHRTRPSTQSSHIHHEPPVGTVRTAPLVTPPKSDRKSVVHGKSVDLGGRRIIKKTPDSSLDTVQTHSPRTTSTARPHGCPCHAARGNVCYKWPPKALTPDVPEVVKRGTGLVPRHSPVTFTTNHQLGPSARLPLSRRQSQIGRASCTERV